MADEIDFREAMTALPSAVIIFDPIGAQADFVNIAAMELIGASQSNPDWGRLISAILDQEPAPSGAERTVEFAFARRDGRTILLRGVLRNCAFEGRRQVLVVLHEMSKARDAELKVMHSAKLATLGEMATAIAHEANQPLAVIKMAAANARRMLESGETGEPLKAKLQRISDQVDRIKRIADQVRRYGRMASRLQDRVGVHEALGLAVGLVGEQYRASGIKLQIDLSFSPDVEVLGEQTMLEQVFVNLLVNARDAIEGRTRTVGQRLVTIDGHLGEGAVIIQVSDNGGGIRPEILDQVFEPFATTKPADKGTGLGLSMSRNIIRDMHGDIRAENFGPGARFTIRLPMASTVAHEAAA